MTLTRRPSISIIIPTYNRINILKKCLHSVVSQHYDIADVEIVVVDDGSSDRTRDYIHSMRSLSSATIRFSEQSHRGPAAARNLGIGASSGDIVLFSGDDIIFEPTLLREHISWHRQFADCHVGVLGCVTWSRELEITPFMRWLETSGQQFDFESIHHGEDVDPRRFFYASNLSLKREYILSCREFFDENFPFAALEDIELGHRLKKKGLVLKYNQRAIGHHEHLTTVKDYFKRMKRVGESSPHFKKTLRFSEDTHFNRNDWNIDFVRYLLVSILKGAVAFPFALFYEKRRIAHRVFWNVGRFGCSLGEISSYLGKS